MPARRGPRADQIDQGNAVAGQVITAGLLFPSFEDNEGGGGGVTDATAAPAILPVQDVIQPQAITDVDDIIDTGGTLFWCKDHLTKKDPASIQIACMLDKKERRKHAVEADYVGYDVSVKARPSRLCTYGHDATITIFPGHLP